MSDIQVADDAWLVICRTQAIAASAGERHRLECRFANGWPTPVTSATRLARSSTAVPKTQPTAKWASPRQLARMLLARRQVHDGDTVRGRPPAANAWALSAWATTRCLSDSDACRRGVTGYGKINDAESRRLCEAS